MQRLNTRKLISTGTIAWLFAAVFFVAIFWLIREMWTGDMGQVKGAGNQGSMVIEVPERVDSSSPFTISVVVDTKGRAINAVAAYATFDTNRLEILEVDTSASFCQFYPENRFDNQKGTLRISCGAPSPGFTGRSTIAKVRVLPKTIGNASFTLLPESQILLNDGRGTNIMEHYPEMEILIVGGV